MLYRKLDTEGDYVFGANQNAYLEGAAAVAQAVSTRLKLLLYEWWEDLEEGLPLWQQIVASKDRGTAEKLIRERIVKTPQVRGILSLNTEWDSERRKFMITATVDTEFGSITLEEVM